MPWNQAKIVATAVALSTVATAFVGCTTWQDWQRTYGTVAPAPVIAQLPDRFYVRNPKRGTCGPDRHVCWEMNRDDVDRRAATGQ